MIRLTLILAALAAIPPIGTASAQAAGAWSFPTAPPISPGDSLRAEDLRVASVAYRLALGGRTYCRADYPLTGLLLHHLAEYEPVDQPFAIERHHVDRGPGILLVVADSPAARAGLVAGDVILSVNGTAFASPAAIAAEAKRKARRKMIEASEAQLEEQLRLGPARLIVLRGDREIALTLDSIPACVARVRLARSAQVNAFADGRYVTATTGLLEFLHNDDELAVVLAHEMSHNILDHPTTLDEQGVPKRGMLRGFGKNASRVWATEAEADRFSIPIIWRSGFDVAAAIPFWRRVYSKHSKLPQIFRTHPSLGARERIVREAIAALPAEAESSR